MEKEGLTPECLLSILFLGTLQHDCKMLVLSTTFITESFHFSLSFCGHISSITWLCLVAKTWWSLIYSEALTLLQYNHSLHLYIAVDSNKAESENLPLSPRNVCPTVLRSEKIS